MKKKVLSLLLITTISLSLLACGEKDKTTDNSDSNDKIEVDENLLSVELTIPSDYVGETTQEELNQTAKEKGYKSITLNEDGSATYVMTKAKHKEMMSELADSINSAMTDMVNSGDYPTFTKVEANSDFTVFTVTTTSTKLNMLESLSAMTFYMYGGMYNAFNDTVADNIQVDFVNADSGTVIGSCNSSDTEK